MKTSGFTPEEFEYLAEELRTTARALLPAIIERKLALLIVACDEAAELGNYRTKPQVSIDVWQPIETAPTNGSYIIGRRTVFADPLICVVSWRAHVLGDDVLADTQMRWRDANGRHFSPTEWMPIPD